MIWLVGHEGKIGEAIINAYGEENLVYGPIDVTAPMVVHFHHLFKGDQKPWGLIYNAGINHLDWTRNLDPAAMMGCYAINVVGLLRCLQAAPSLKRVVVIGSDAARRPMRTSAAYNCSKAALEVLVQTVARERAHEGFVINTVAPGLIEGTAMTEYVYARTAQIRPGFPDLHDYMIGQIPAGRAGKAYEVAEVVLWLMNDAPNYINGETINVNGAR